MEFRISDTFTDSLTRLNRDEQKFVKTTAFDLQVDPTAPGMQFHRIDHARDSNFWSVRVSSDIRIIVHKTADSLMLCYVDHHDAAYRWAERRKIERHPRTGAAQLVEIRETVREIEVPRYVEADRPMEASPPESALPFAEATDDQLLRYGVPPEWLGDVREATEESLLALTDHLPPEAAEALLEVATGGTPKLLHFAAASADPFAHPDAQRRFRVMANAEELERAFVYPWEKWTVFLHPAQREIVERQYSGPARVAGSAGTGKTIVAIHRAVHLARRNPTAQVLLTTFSDTLANALRARLRRLVGNEPAVAQRITIASIEAVGIDLFTRWFGKPALAPESRVREAIYTAARAAGGHKFTDRFIENEWREVVDAWQLRSWESYRDVTRLGRKTRLGEKQREALWSIFELVRAQLAQDSVLTIPMVFGRLTEALRTGRERPFAFAVVDEAQDIGVPHLQFLAALAGSRPDGLFFAGDLGQRIFQTPFSWLLLGVDVRGRSQTLRINYRTSHQIRRQADRLLPAELADVDGVAESRRGTISVFNSPDPEIRIAKSQGAESSHIASWLKSLSSDSIQPHEIGVFVRAPVHLNRARNAIAAAGLKSVELDDNFEIHEGAVAVSTMHRAKGLEFRAVVVAACDDEALPLQERVESVTDTADLEEVYNTERHLLYVACTRARERLLITGVAPVSEFIDDLYKD